VTYRSRPAVSQNLAGTGRECIVDGPGKRRRRAQDRGIRDYLFQQVAGVISLKDEKGFIAAAKTRQWEREKSVRTLA
jgi:catalase